MKLVKDKEILLDADFQQTYHSDWFEERDCDPIRAINRALQLPPDSRLKKTLSEFDAERWTDELQMLSLVKLSLDQIKWWQPTQSMADQKSMDKYKNDSPYPAEAYSPDEFKAAVERSEENTKKVEQEQRAATVLSHGAEMRNALLNLPRPQPGDADEDEILAEDDM